MKNKKILLILFTFICFVSCSNDDSESKTNAIPQELIGKWKATYAIGDVVDLDQNGNPIVYMVPNQYLLELKSNGTFTSNEFPNYSGGTFTLNEASYFSYIKLKYLNDDGGQFFSYKIFSHADNSKMTLSVSLENTPTSTAPCDYEEFIKVQ
jgi:hypothetical protein